MGATSWMKIGPGRAMLLAAACVAGTFAAAVTGSGVAGAAAGARLAGPAAPAWASSLAGGQASAEAVSPDGKTVYTTGFTTDFTSSAANFRTVAYNAATGAQLWTATYSGPMGEDTASAIAVSPNGTSVYVTGASRGAQDASQVATVAYAAATGTQQWVARSDGEATTAVAVSPNGASVYVAGVTGAGSDLTIAYTAATGAQRWLRDHSGDSARLAVSPGGRTVYLVGQDTVAYNAATGAVQWAHALAFTFNTLVTGAVSPNGKTVFVTGDAAGNYGTIAFSAATGKRLWEKFYNGPAGKTDTPHALAIGSGGKTIYVTGSSRGTGSKGGPGFDFATVAYSVASGKQLWAERYAGPTKATDGGRVVTVAPGGRTVYVTGTVHRTLTSGTAPTQYATIAYNAATGAQLWVALHNPAPSNNNTVVGTVISANGSMLFVAGSSLTLTGPPATNYETFAYKV